MSGNSSDAAAMPSCKKRKVSLQPCPADVEFPEAALSGACLENTESNERMPTTMAHEEGDAVGGVTAAKRALLQLATEGDDVTVDTVVELLAAAGYATDWLKKLDDDDDDDAYEIVCDAMEEAMQQDGCVAEALDRARQKVLLEEQERQEELRERGTECSDCKTPWSEESGMHDDGEGNLDLCDSCMCGACGTRREYEGQMGGTCRCG